MIDSPGWPRRRRPGSIRGRFAEKVFLVTGGGRGIGRAIARRLVDDGARVCIVDRDRHADQEARGSGIAQQGIGGTR